MGDPRPSRPGKQHPMATSGSKSRPPVGPWSMSTRARTNLAKAVAAVPKPVQVPLVKEPPPNPRRQFAEVVAGGVTDIMGLQPGSKKARALSTVVVGAVFKATAKSVSMQQVAEVIKRVKGPPPKVQQVLVPVGSIAEAAAKVANASVTPKLLLKNVQSAWVSLLVSLGSLRQARRRQR